MLDDIANSEWLKAIENALTDEGADDTRSMAQRRGDAMFDIAAFYNKNHQQPGTPRNHPQINLSVNASTLSGTPQGVDEDGRPVDTACVDTRLCDCMLHTIIRDGHDVPYAFGRTRYTIPKKQFRQLAARDGGCRFPGCNRRVRYCDGHHIHYWRRGGVSDYDNMTIRKSDPLRGPLGGNPQRSGGAPVRCRLQSELQGCNFGFWLGRPLAAASWS